MVASVIEHDPAIGALLGETTTEIDVARKNRVFCNRNLRMDTIEMIGFDMDYTLALYNQRNLENLSIRCTLDKMIEKRGYPQEIKQLDYDYTFGLRGIVVDRQEGNIFKMDRYGHIGRVFHGAQDDVVPARYSQEFAATHPNATLEVVDSGHELLNVLEYMAPKVIRFLSGE